MPRSAAGPAGDQTLGPRRVSDSVKLGQETFILGYPHAEWGGGGASGQRFPAPFVKKATVAVLPGETGVVRCLFLDGYSNQGFAGGPVVFREADTGVFRVAAVA